MPIRWQLYKVLLKSLIKMRCDKSRSVVNTDSAFNRNLVTGYCLTPASP